MARTSMLVALVAVVAAVAARHAELRQNSTDKIVRPSKCPLFMGAIACLQSKPEADANLKPELPGSSSCESSEHCNEGDECCVTLCSRDCYNEEIGFYKGKLVKCRPVPFVHCFWYDQQCSSEKPCDAGEVCCPVLCGTACF